MVQHLLLLMHLIALHILFIKIFLCYSVVQYQPYNLLEAPFGSAAATSCLKYSNTKILMRIYMIDEVSEQGYALAKITVVFRIIQFGFLGYVQLFSIDTIFYVLKLRTISDTIVPILFKYPKIHMMIFIRHPIFSKFQSLFSPW